MRRWGQVRTNTRWLCAFSLCFSVFLAFAFAGFITSSWQSSLTLLQKGYLLATQWSWLGLFALLLALGSILLVFLPILWFRALVLVGASFIVMVLNIDLNVFSLYKLHINGLMITMFLDGGEEVFNLSWLTWLILIGQFLLLLVGLALCAWLAARWRNSKWVTRLILIWFVTLFTSQTLHAWKNALYDSEVSQFSQNWPLFYPLTARKLMANLGLVDVNVARQNRVTLSKVSQKELHYPLQPVSAKLKSNPPNVLFIMVDAWRYQDAIAKVMPNVTQFAERTAQFHQHMSGGNSTLAGLFSLFYSLPATYWSSFQASQTPPVFVDLLIKHGYKMGIFGSAPLTSPPLSRTIFKQDKQLRLETPGKNSVERDQRITRDFINFTHQQTSPYLGFLFYDSAHNADFPSDNAPFKPYWKRVDHLLLNNEFDPRPYHNRYLNALHFIDGLIQQVLDNIDLDNTIIVISSDHGEEFNDHHMNYWGHTGNYSDIQIHVPFYLYIPHKDHQSIHYRTTHYDVVPTLLEQLFELNTPTRDFSIGYNLFSPTPPRTWFIAGSYYNYALVGTQSMLVVNPTGDTEALSSQLEPLDDNPVPLTVINQALQEMSRFYQK